MRQSLLIWRSGRERNACIGLPAPLRPDEAREKVMNLTLYDLQGIEDRRFSPYCWRARLALAHKGLKAAIVPVKYTDKDAIAFSGQTKVPVLADGETAVSNSWTIACYLEDNAPDRPSLFGCAVGRGAARLIDHWMDGAVVPHLFRLLIGDIYDHVCPEDREYFRTTREARLGKTIEAAREERAIHLEPFRRSLEPLRATLEEQPYLSGQAPAYPDYIVFSAFQWARSVSPLPVIEREDPLSPWRERMLDLFGGLARSVPAYDY